jgi:CheY-like chemotaxis protein
MSDDHDFPGHRLFCATWSNFQEEFGVSPLPHTLETARGIAAALKTAGVLAEQVTINDDDSVAVRNHLDAFLAGPGDNVILYFGSHGLLPGARNSLYRLATGDTLEREDGIRSFPIAEVISILGKHPHRNVLLLVDACFSGNAGDDVVGQATTLDRGPLTRSGMSFLASSSPFEVSLAPKNSKTTLFGSHVISAINNWPDDKEMTAGDLLEALQASRKETDPEPVFVSQGNSHKSTLLPATTQDPTDPEFRNRAAVLYVDDTERERTGFRRAVEARGHVVTLAEDAEEAGRALETSHFDVIVLDLLMQEDAPAIDLIRNVGALVEGSRVIVTSRNKKKAAWRHIDNVFAYPNRIDSFVFKADHIDQAIEFANDTRERRKQVLSRVHGVDGCIPLVSGRVIKRKYAGHELGPELLQLYARITIERLLSRWFSPESDATKYIHHMTMKPLGSGRSSCSVFSLVPAIEGLDDGQVSPLVLKIGPAEEIKEEVARFNKFVQVGVPLSVRTDLVCDATTGAIGGLIYSLIGGDQQDIREAARLDTESIEHCLRALMNPDGKRWLAATPTEEGVRPCKFFTDKNTDPAKQWNRRRFEGAAIAMNTGLRNAKVDASWEVDPDFMDEPGVDHEMPATLVHGDLHLGNVVAYDDGKGADGRLNDRYALIDYRNVAVGPRCADFATLEVDCWLLAVPDTDKARRGEVIADLRRAMSGGMLDTREPGEIPTWLQDSHLLATTVRELAMKNFKDLDQAEYGSMLWFTAVRRSEMRTATSDAENTALKTVPHALALEAQEMVLRT